MKANNLQTITVGGGCFWCIEAIFNQIEGVENVVSGYTGGTVPGTPTYREVCSGRTGHAEVIQANFDASIISYEELLVIFMTSHNPTTSNQQGVDVGSQYRSVIYYHDNEQKEIAEEVVKQLAPYFENSITTEISESEKFHAAEAYHQDYYANNQSQGYCTAVITPKLVKLRKMHANRLKTVTA
ncbi:peptide-methionine (S)-S-oxide reductase MsrA [Dokdonia sp.]|uniref:peptide-methionine (S)-S-oxide reductase MsrA n=1 Tax=Dokdonia sp. TaxID=2024995 RepID=UPI003267E6F0